MHRALFAAVLASLLSSWAAAADSLHVLFIGNSYTGVNKLPQIFQQIVASTGTPAPEVKASTPGSRTLTKHLEEEGTLKLIDEGRWDVVILQGQSTEAAKQDPSGKIGTTFLAGAQNLCQRIQAANPQARIVFYQRPCDSSRTRWRRRSGLSSPASKTAVLSPAFWLGRSKAW